MRISDWSSDVCSSDLGDLVQRGVRRDFGRDKRRRGGGCGLRRHLFVADGAAGGQGEDAEQGAGECMALHGCLPWWSGWRTARPRQWGYGEYASCAGFVPAPGAVSPERWRGVRCGALGSGYGERVGGGKRGAVGVG